MIVKNIKLSNFRNYSSINTKLNEKMNIFIGKNAQGKTNILESICVLALTKTYKNGVEPNLITFNKTKTKICGKVKDNRIIKNLEVVIELGNKKLFINNDLIKKTSDYISNLNVIVFTPEDLDIIKGSPSIRRNLINMELSQISNKYLNTYNEYNKLLKMRNEYLKLLFTSSIADKKYFDIITEKLIEKATIIYSERKKYVDLINKNINTIYKKITGDSGLYVEYINNIDMDDYDINNIGNCLRKKYELNYKKELNNGLTLYGPHRDDFLFNLENKDLKYFGSQGQQKVAIISFKLSEIDIFYKYRGSKPVLLLDDIFSELDIQKRNKLLDLIGCDIQSIITTTDLKNIRKKYVKDSYIYEINNGNIERRQ